MKTILPYKTAQQTHKTRLHLLRMFKLQYCTKFGQLILRKIIKIVATRCHILRLNAPNSISAGAPLQTPLGELTALPQTPIESIFACIRVWFNAFAVKLNKLA